MLRRLLVLGLVTSLATALLASAASAAPPAEVDVCHFNSLGEWQVNTLRDKGKGVQAHLAHGDALPGEEVPGMADYEFNADCQPVLIPGSIVITKATNPAGGTGFGFTDNISAPNSFTLDDGQSETFTNVVPGTYAVSETVPSGWDLTSATCDDGSTPSAIVVSAGETVTCTFTNTVQNPGIDIEKLTNGNQADGANGGDVPVINSGAAITWTYNVTNTGDVAFPGGSVVVTDDVLGVVAGPVSGDANNNGLLDPGEVWVYEASSVADALTSAASTTVPGCGDDRPTYENVGTVNTGSVSDSDPSHYCNPQPVTGDWQMATGHDDVAYKRLAVTVDLTAAATGSVDFSTSYGIESDWDYMFVEVHTVGADDWTTLPDANGHTSQDTGASCPGGWADLHPQLFHYQDLACSPFGTTGGWNAASGVSEGIEQWSIDLSAYAGSQVEVLISFATDWSGGDLGVFVDDAVVTVDGAVVSVTSFEDGLGDWTIPGAPDGSLANPNDWQRIS